ncbi:MAG: hypothetical protein NWF01_00645 [Candidatus Bathyarchaeota archaeon]|nr:hypothetical protein [Candidatus Bathyarchaeota archaeon]
MQVSCVFAVEDSFRAEDLAFMRDILGIDISKYSLAGVNTVGDRTKNLESTLYSFASGGNEFSVDHYASSGHSFYSIEAYGEGARSVFVDAKASTVEEAKAILERYQAKYDVSYVQHLISSLDMFSLGKQFSNVSKTMGDTQLVVDIDVDKAGTRSELITWSRSVNGVYNRHDIISFHFVNGVLRSFADSWNRYEIGSSSVNVDEAAAISIAKEEAAKTWWTSGNETVRDVVVVDKSILTELYYAPREGLLYPFWVIRMGLDKVYPGGVTSITAVIRADTGQPDGISTEASYGADDAPSQTSTPPPETDTPQNPNILPIALAIACLIIIAATIIVVKKRQGTN